MPLLVIVERGQQYTYQVNKDEFTIGRSDRADLVLADRFASRVHAVITTDGKHYYITDRGSANGTLLNKTRISSVPAKLRHGDQIRVAGTVIRFIDHDMDTGEYDMVAAPPSPMTDLARNTTIDMEAVRPDQIDGQGGGPDSVPTPAPSTINTRRVQYHHVFISHATPDDEYVNKLASDLQRHTGFTGWVDHRMSEPGADWISVVELALEHADVMIVVLSPHSVDSRYVRAEWNHFLNARKPIFPLKIAECRVPLFLRTLQVLDLTQQPPGVMQPFFEAVKHELNTLNQTQNQS